MEPVGGGGATNSISTGQLMGLRAASLTAVSFSFVSVLHLLSGAVRRLRPPVRVTEGLAGSAASGVDYVVASYTPDKSERRFRLLYNH